MLIHVRSDKYYHPKLEISEVELLMRLHNRQTINIGHDLDNPLLIDNPLLRAKIFLHNKGYLQSKSEQPPQSAFKSTVVLLTDKAYDWIENFEKLPLQTRITTWAHVTFKSDVLDIQERAYRFGEEALELMQSIGISREDLHKLIDYVYNREPGEKKQEIGGVVTTLAVLASVHDLSVEECAVKELDRIWTRIDDIRRKQETKPKASPLQGSAD